MFSLSKLHLFIVHFLMGPFKTQFKEADGRGKVPLIKVAGQTFELVISYEINTYSKIYDRWWIPDHHQRVIKLSTLLTGSPPEYLKIICEQELHLPFNGSAEKPSVLQLYNALNLYLDIITQYGIKLQNLKSV